MDSLAGQLLIASPRLTDPNFAQAVVLVVSHDENGALGLIVNRPMDTKVKDAIAESEVEIATDETLSQGGPCPGPLMAVHNDPSAAQMEVVPGVWFTADKDHIELFLQEPTASVRYFVGYAGWTAGQLEAEIESGSWFVVTARPKHIYEPGPRLWQKWVTIITGELGVSPDALPDDPFLN